MEIIIIFTFGGSRNLMLSEQWTAQGMKILTYKFNFVQRALPAHLNSASRKQFLIWLICCLAVDDSRQKFSRRDFARPTTGKCLHHWSASLRKVSETLTWIKKAAKTLTGIFLRSLSIFLKRSARRNDDLKTYEEKSSFASESFWSKFPPCLLGSWVLKHVADDCWVAMRNFLSSRLVMITDDVLEKCFHSHFLSLVPSVDKSRMKSQSENWSPNQNIYKAVKEIQYKFKV